MNWKTTTDICSIWNQNGSIFVDQPQCFTEAVCDKLYSDLKYCSGDWSLQGCVNMTGFNTT